MDTRAAKRKLQASASSPWLSRRYFTQYRTHIRFRGSLWKNIAGNGAQRFVGVLNGSLDGLKRGADASVAALRSGVRSSEAAGKAVIFTWRDADGITHFSQTAPSGVTSRTVTIDPNVNVLAPVRAPSIGETETPGAASSARAADVIADDLRDLRDLRAIGSLPGVAEQF